MKLTEVVVSHLVMTAASQLRPSERRVAGIILAREAESNAASAARECYLKVGEPWFWTDRIHWDNEMWAQYLREGQCEVWTARRDAELVGYFLMATEGDTVDIRYFGLVPTWIGQGIGGWLLTRAVEQAWALKPERVTLNTCSLDGPNALSNYLSRGFQVTREEKVWRQIPA